MFELQNRCIDFTFGEACYTSALASVDSNIPLLTAISFPLFFGILTAVLVVLLLVCAIAIRRIIFDDGRTDFSSQLDQEPRDDDDQSSQKPQPSFRTEKTIASADTLTEDVPLSGGMHDRETLVSSSDTTDNTGSSDAIETETETRSTGNELDQPARELRADPSQMETEVSTDNHFSHRPTVDSNNDQSLTNDDTDDGC